MKKLFIYFSLFIFHFSLTQAQIINTIAGNGVAGFSGDGGQATNAELWSPSGIFVDRTGIIYVADGLNNRIRKIDTDGIINTIAGNGYNPGGDGGYSGDGGPATDAELANPQSICTDMFNNIYIADYKNNRIRRIDNSGVITTIAGNGAGGYGGDGGPATSAELMEPACVCLDTSKNIYIADGNTRIRKIDVLGVISTVAGHTGGLFTNGVPATSTSIGEVYGLFVTDSGNIYMSSGYSRILKVNTSGIVYSIAGNGIEGYSGDGGPATAAEFFDLAGVFMDNAGNIYIADVSNQRVRELNYYTGIITTIAGSATGGYSGDGGSATDAELNGPAGVFMDSHNNLYITDYYNYRIRKVSGLPSSINSIKESGFEIYPNPVSQSLYLDISAFQTEQFTIQIMDVLGRKVMNTMESASNTPIRLNVFSLSEGVYFIHLSATGISYTAKFVKIR